MIKIFAIIILFFLLIILVSTILFVVQIYSTIINQKEHKDIAQREIKFLKLYNKKSFDKYILFSEIINIDKNFDVKLHYMSNTKKLDKVNFVVFHHGIKTNHEIGFKYSLIYLERKEPFVFVSYDSRGWGESSEGKTSSYGYYEKIDLHKIIEYIKKTYNPKKLYLHGESMGGATLLQYLYHYKDSDNLNGLIVDSPYTSFRNVLKYHSHKNFPIIPFYYIFFFLELYFYFKHKFWIHDISLDRSLSDITTPVYVIFSECDALIPFDEYELLKQSSLNFNSYITKDSPHVLTIAFHKKEYILKINNFLNQTDSIKKYNIKNLTEIVKKSN